MCKDSNKFETLLTNSKIGEMLAESKLAELVNKKKEDPIEEKKHTLVFVLAIIGAVAAIAAIAYAVYRYMTPSYLEEFDDEDLDFDDAEDETPVEEKAEETEVVEE